MSRPCPPPDQRRPSIIYGFNILDPDTGRVRMDYVGQTVQTLAARERQHRGQDFDVDPCEQPWSDLIVGKPVILKQGMWTKKERDDWETHYIHTILPRYNHDENLLNPERIPIPVARRQREERDRARGVPSPTWEKPTRPAAQPGVNIRSGFEWTPGRKRAATLAGVWLALSGVLGTLFAHMVAVTGPTALEVGAAASTALFAAVWYARLSRRKRRAVRRWLAGMAVAAGLSVVAWIVLASNVSQAVSR